MEMGRCLVCEDMGPIHEWCQDCAEAPYDEISTMGNCHHCKQEGIRGCLCTHCEDCAFIYE